MHSLKEHPTDGADDASVTGHSGLRVNVQQTHVFNEGVRHCSVKLLGVDDGGAHILGLRHDWIYVCWRIPAEKEETAVTSPQTWERKGRSPPASERDCGSRAKSL